MTRTDDPSDDSQAPPSRAALDAQFAAWATRTNEASPIQPVDDPVEEPPRRGRRKGRGRKKRR